MAKGTLPEPLTGRKLAIATAVSLVVAGLGLATVILPSAYGLDPLGAGRALGTLDEERAPLPERSDTFNITFEPASADGAGNTHEFKLFMREGGSVTFTWRAQAEGNATPEIYVDRHGEPEDGAAGEFESYGSGTMAANEGTITAPFTGTHGWYFENRSNTTVTITLAVDGRYTIEGLIS